MTICKLAHHTLCKNSQQCYFEFRRFVPCPSESESTKGAKWTSYFSPGSVWSWGGRSLSPSHTQEESFNCLTPNRTDRRRRLPSPANASSIKALKAANAAAHCLFGTAAYGKTVMVGYLPFTHCWGREKKCHNKRFAMMSNYNQICLMYHWTNRSIRLMVQVLAGPIYIVHSS